ncbi:hypothetical protein M514_03858 [Trichuris suis]|uniref:Fe2OG dioxygenase domain-containing protein n=1 Tax=Trichuris suis TaxID=68888 RepID=A0A085N7L8_9BILA|nr:hypothetical protein M514_03858 [Trichuris suis]
MVVMRCLDDLENYRVCELPATAFYVANFLSSAEEKYLWNKVFAAPLPRWTKVNGRRVQNWGGIVGKKALIQVNDIPEWLSSFMEKFGSISGLFPADMKPNHVLVNEYEPGQGIMLHTDGLAYYPMVINVTLGSHAVLDLFKQTDGKNCCIGSLLLEPCSLFVMKDELYTDHLHGIENRCTDTVDEKVKNKALCSEQYSHGCVLERGKRISLTIRNIPRVVRALRNC